MIQYKINTELFENQTYVKNSLYNEDKEKTKHIIENLADCLKSEFLYTNNRVRYKTVKNCLIESHSDNLELRFLRLTIQDNVPNFLGYNANLKEDKEFIHNNLSKILDEDLQERITYYLSYNNIIKLYKAMEEGNSFFDDLSEDNQDLALNDYFTLVAEALNSIHKKETGLNIY